MVTRGPARPPSFDGSKKLKTKYKIRKEELQDKDLW
jgi:hypothetical protein